MISPEYKEMNKTLHEQHPEYGISGQRYTEIAREVSKWGRRDVLDYGCGKATLSNALGPAYKVTNYDPCIPGRDTPPEPHEIVVCTDVMEHIEPEFVDDVLRDIRRLTKDMAFFSIYMKEALKVLPDGRNAHISQHPYEWWKEHLEAAGFEIVETVKSEGEFRGFGAFCK